MRRYDADNQTHVDHLQRYVVGDGALPRRTRYGSTEAASLGLQPLGDMPDKLLDPADFKEAIAYAHEHRVMPMYHQARSWAPDGFKYNQDGLPYCWTWSGTATLMDCRATEGKPTVPLAPVSMGWLVGWRSRGNYLESYIKGAREEGVAPAECCGGINSHNRDPDDFDPAWKTERKKYRLDEVWDCDSRDMVRHAVSCLCYGVPVYIAYNWWRHALELVGVRWDESQRNNVVWQIRNSHNEDDLIELTGSRGVPSEAFGFVSTKATGA